MSARRISTPTGRRADARAALSAGLSQDAVDRRVRSGHWRRWHAACTSSTTVHSPMPRECAPRCGATAARRGKWDGRSVVAWPDTVRTRHRRGDGAEEQSRQRHERLPGSKARSEARRRSRAPSTRHRVGSDRRRGRGPAPRRCKLMDSALQRRVELRGLWRAHLRNKGRYGSPAARLLLQAAADGARSEAERLLIRLLKAARITGWQANYPVAGYRVDVGFPKQKVAIEVDGLAFHSDRRIFTRPGAPECHHVGRLAGPAIHLAGPDGVPGPRDRRDPVRDFAFAGSQPRREGDPDEHQRDRVSDCHPFRPPSRTSPTSTSPAGTPPPTSCRRAA